MKIYTRTGDKGETGLLGGERVAKYHGRIEAYGTVDELNSHLGLLRDQAPEEHRALLERIQDTLFALGSRLACASDGDAERFKLPHLTDAQVKALEEAMDSMDRELPPMRHFILPGGHPCVSQAHICRTVCRRAVTTGGGARDGGPDPSLDGGVPEPAQRSAVRPRPAHRHAAERGGNPVEAARLKG